MAGFGSVGDLVRDESGSIPLECILCPKRPKFSDVSHLLTHISSKSHLHNKFNIEFQAKSEAGPRDKLRKYERWYSENGIETLLADRLAAKDQKKTVRRGRPAGSGAKTRPSSRMPESIKPDPEDAYGVSDYLPPIGHWSTNTMPLDGHSFHLHEARHDVYYDDSIYRTPEIKRSRSPFGFDNEIDDPYPSRFGSPRSTTETTDNAVPSDVTTVITADATEEEMQNSKLKGVVWPGMALFDSATPDQKRKRNQRKDSSVLEQMKLTSQAVTAIECVWAPDGEMQRIRDIYASPSIDGSPLSTPPRKRKYRARQRTPTRSDTATAPKSKADAADNNKKKKGRRLALVDLNNVRQTRSAAKSAEKGRRERFGGGKAGPNTKAGMEDGKRLADNRDRNGNYDIFRDPPDPSPGRTESPLDDFQENRFDLPHRPALQQMTSNMLMTSPTSLMKQSSARFYNAGRDSPQLSYRTPATYSSAYGGTQHAMTGSTYNPLCAQPRGGGSFQYHSPHFDDAKVPTTSFQPINGRLEYGTFDINPNTNPYTNSAPRDTVDYDL